MRLRIAAYCRVSTDKAEQSNSFESQQKYFYDYIARTPGWEPAGVFADEGKSGTSTKHRAAFNDMINRAYENEFDMIITKEISRFARNTLDSIYYTRELKRHGVGVIFLNDNINTLDPDAELRLTIMSSIAQEESRRTSERVRWGQKRRMEQGVVFGRSMLGYDVREGKMYVNENGAEIVRLIFGKYVRELKGAHTIARELSEAGCSTLYGGNKWTNIVVSRILANEKYCGDLIQKKTITPDYLTHDKKYNRGEEQLIVIRNHHEPIVSRELFEEAAKLMEARHSGENRSKHSNRYAFSGKLKCKLCGASYVSRIRNSRQTWRCYEAVRYGRSRCPSRSISNEALTSSVKEAVDSFNADNKVIAADIVKLINQIAKPKAGTSATAGKKARLLELYMDGGIERDEFMAARERLEAEETKETKHTGNCRITISDVYDAMNDGEFYRNVVERIIITENGEPRIELYLR